MHEKEVINPEPKLPVVSPDIYTNLDIRFAFAGEENKRIMREENPLLFSTLKDKNFYSTGAFIIYWPLRAECKQNNKQLPCVSQKTIDQYFQNPFWRKIANLGAMNLPPSEEHQTQIEEMITKEESIFPLKRLTQEQPFLPNYLEWVLSIFDDRMNETQLRRLGISSLVAYDLLSIQAEKDYLESIVF